MAQKKSVYSGMFKRGVTERGVFGFACLRIVSPRGRTGNRTVTQMRHPLLVEGRPNCAQQSLASIYIYTYCRHLAWRRDRTVIPVATQMSLPPVLLTPCSNPMYVQYLKVLCYGKFCYGKFWPEFKYGGELQCQDTFDRDKRQKSAILGIFSTGFCVEILQWIFLISRQCSL